VDLPGYQPKGDGDGVHVGNDMSVIDRALRMLKQKVDGIPAQETIRKVRTNSVCPNDELVPCSRSDRPHLTSLSEAWSNRAVRLFSWSLFSIATPNSSKSLSLTGKARLGFFRSAGGAK
jgi:hypothetical protein